MTAIDPTAVSVANAAWATASAAQQQVWASWAAAEANVLVVITVTWVTLREGRRARRARLRSASMSVHHAMEILQMYFESQEKLGPNTVLDIEDSLGLVLLAKEASATTAMFDIDNENLRMLADNARTVVGSIEYSLVKIKREQRKPLVQEYLSETAALRQSASGILDALDENWK